MCYHFGSQFFVDLSSCCCCNLYWCAVFCWFVFSCCIDAPQLVTFIAAFIYSPFVIFVQVSFINFTIGILIQPGVIKKRGVPRNLSINRALAIRTKKIIILMFSNGTSSVQLGKNPTKLILCNHKSLHITSNKCKNRGIYKPTSSTLMPTMLYY